MSLNNSFGNYFKEMRLKAGFTLRKFCQTYNLDPGNISKLERGKLRPPSSQKLEQYANCLKIPRGSNEWYEFFDLAAAEAGRIPEDVMSDEMLVEKLPLVFRTLRGQKVSEEQLEELIGLIRRS